MMKRSFDHFDMSDWIPREKLRTDGPTWEDTMVSPRINDLSDKLLDCLMSYNVIDKAGAFMKCLEDDCTPEEFLEISQLRLDQYGESMLHVAIRVLNHKLGVKEMHDVFQMLIEVNPNMILAPDIDGNTPLHDAVKKHLPKESFEFLLNANPTRSALFVQNKWKKLPLHYALDRQRDTSVVQLLYDSQQKKEILATEDNKGQVPFYLACLISHPAFEMLAEERILLAPPAWRASLRRMVHKFKELNKALDKVNFDREKHKKAFSKFFLYWFERALSEYNEDLYKLKGMHLLEFAVWKVWGLPDKKEERQAKWVTYEAQQIATEVGEFLEMDTMDTIGMLQSQYDHLSKLVLSRAAVSRYSWYQSRNSNHSWHQSRNSKKGNRVSLLQNAQRSGHGMGYSSRTRGCNAGIDWSLWGMF